MKHLKIKTVRHAGLWDGAFLRIMEVSNWGRMWLMQVLEVTEP